MNGAFYIGATGLAAEQRALEVIANNIANINTPAFKRAEVRFSELVAENGGTSDQPLTTNGLAPLLGVMVDSSPRLFAQGEITQTGKPLDLAIDGDGFIELMGPGGQAMLWRGGTLQVNSDGYLAGANGLPLKAMISVPTGSSQLSVGSDGKVQALLPGQTSPTEIGQIDLALPKDMTTLQSMNNGLYQTASESDLLTVAPGQDGGGVISPGALESSNVQLADEMITLLLLQRAYAANAQVVQAGDQLMSIANSLRR
ncbi:MAG: flagellar hook-basal body protein [Caulobacterales bacterium]